jgi:hypothetical protein
MTNDLIGEYHKLNLFLDNFEKTYKGTLIMNEAGVVSSTKSIFPKDFWNHFDTRRKTTF